MESSCSSASSSSSVPKVVIRGGHIIPSIRLTPPDSRPAMAPCVPEQDLGSSSLFVPLRTEEIGWEEGGLIWAAKRYFYPTVNLYGGSDDHIIGTYRGGPKGYRFVNITDEDFSLAGSCDEGAGQKKESKTSQNGSKSALPKGPATTKHSDNSRIIDSKTEDVATIEVQTTIKSEATKTQLSPSSSLSSTPTSSRRGSNSTEGDDNSSGADTGLTTPTSECSREGRLKQHSDKDLADELEAALFTLQQDVDEETNQESKKTRLLASRTGAGEICIEPVDASRLAGPIKSQLYNNGLGHDRSLTLSDSIPIAHFPQSRGRSRSRRSLEAEYSAGWAYEQNMKQQHTLSQ